MTNAEHDDHGSDPNDTDGIRHDTDGAASGTWARVKEIFGDALELPAADRELFVWTRSESAGIAEEVLAMLARIIHERRCGSSSSRRSGLWKARGEVEGATCGCATLSVRAHEAATAV